MVSIVGSQTADIYPEGTAGADTYTLLGGNDYASGGAGDDNLFGGVGEDVLNGDAGNDVMAGGLGSDVLSGGDGNDLLAGGGGDKADYDDNTRFNDGNDALQGGAGNDVLWGMGGNDILTGGADADIFLFGPREGQDVITDFVAGEDKINLSMFFGGSNLDSNANGVIDGGDLGVTVDANNVTHIDFAAYGAENTVLHIGGGAVLHPSDFI
jgi:Ca2+-binding RTX toxin-like protein